MIPVNGPLLKASVGEDPSSGVLVDVEPVFTEHVHHVEVYPQSSETAKSKTLLEPHVDVVSGSASPLPGCFSLDFCKRRIGSVIGRIGREVDPEGSSPWFAGKVIVKCAQSKVEWKGRIFYMIVNQDGQREIP